MRFPEVITIGEKYGPAMEIEDPHLATQYFEACVQHYMRFGISREEAERIERTNLGYYSGYCNRATQARVERLFGAVHPIFGPVGGPDEPKTPEETFEMGEEMAKKRLSS